MAGIRQDGAGRAQPAAILFIGVALALSGLYWLVAAGQPRSAVLGTLRGYGPAVAGLVACLAWAGPAGLRDLARRLTIWRVPGRYYLLAFAGPALVAALCVLAMHLSGTAATLDPSAARPRLILVFVAMTFLDGPLGEEIGWRGVLLPRLLERTGAVAASAIIGVVWWLWHIPLYAADARAMGPAFLSQYLVSVVSYSFIYTWFFVRTRGSALFAVLLHATTNYFVYVAATLVPATRETLVDNRVYLALVALTGVSAAMSLARRPQPGNRAEDASAGTAATGSTWATSV